MTDNVVRLPVEDDGPSRPPPIHRPVARLHSIAIVGMALSALIGITAMLAYITISWPKDLKAYPFVVFVGAIVIFMTSASIAVFSAARNTYPRAGSDR